MHRMCLLRLALASVLTAMVAEAAAPVAAAGPITYTTHGSVWPWTFGNGAQPGITGPQVVTFQGVSAGTIDGPGDFSLGRFTIVPPPAGSSATYSNAAFSVTLDTSLGNQPIPAGSADVPFSSVTVDGVLSGVVSGSDPSSLVARVLSIHPNMPLSIPEQPITPILDMPFRLSDLSVEPTGLLSLSPGAGGEIGLVGQLSSSAPEPASVFLVLAGVAGFALRAGIRRCSRARS